MEQVKRCCTLGQKWSWLSAGHGGDVGMSPTVGTQRQPVGKAAMLSSAGAFVQIPHIAAGNTGYILFND